MIFSFYGGPLKRRNTSLRQEVDLEDVHWNLVIRLLVGFKPSGRTPALRTQWLVWLGVSIGAGGLAVLLMGFQPDMGISRRAPNRGFLLFAVLGAALAAWEAVSSSVPGRQVGWRYRTMSGITLLLLTMMPFLYFHKPGEDMHPLQDLIHGMGCVLVVSTVGTVPWLILGWLVSRNASFNPVWTGAWSGVAAFLVGTTAIQLHCPIWASGHLLSAHLLPAALFALLSAFLGAHWFSRWRK